MIPDNCPRKTGIGSCSELPIYHKECCEEKGELYCPPPLKIRWKVRDIIIAAKKAELLEEMPKEEEEFGGTYADVQIIIGQNIMLRQVLEVIERVMK
jgi:hypothetical protein